MGSGLQPTAGRWLYFLWHISLYTPTSTLCMPHPFSSRQFGILRNNPAFWPTWRGRSGWPSSIKTSRGMTWHNERSVGVCSVCQHSTVPFQCCVFMEQRLVLRNKSTKESRLGSLGNLGSYFEEQVHWEFLLLLKFPDSSVGHQLQKKKKNPLNLYWSNLSWCCLRELYGLLLRLLQREGVGAHTWTVYVSICTYMYVLCQHNHSGTVTTL